MDAAALEHNVVSTATVNPNDWQESYKPLPVLYFGLLVVWSFLVIIWTLNTWSKRQWQTNNLQWVLTSVPTLKALVLGLSFVFWYSCLSLGTCSFWVAFGVFVTRIFFETACFIGFLLISHGYCIMYEQLSAAERRSIAVLSSLLYLTLTGYKAAVPQFAVLVLAIYFILLYVIFLRLSKNLKVLREQLQHIQDEGVQLMQSAVHMKYKMFRKFQGAMMAIVVAEVLMHTRADGAANEYWIRLLVREWIEIAIFLYIGWTFRSRDVTPFFTVIPTLHSHDQRSLPPIYSIEMNESEFNNLDFSEWHIGVPTSVSCASSKEDERSALVIVRNPGVSPRDDNCASTSDIPSTTSSLTRHIQATANLKTFSTKTTSSHCFLRELLKPETRRSFNGGGDSEKACKYRPCLTADRDVFYTKRNFSFTPSSGQRNHNKSNDASHHRILFKGRLPLEPMFSQLV